LVQLLGLLQQAGDVRPPPPPPPPDRRRHPWLRLRPIPLRIQLWSVGDRFEWAPCSSGLRRTPAASGCGRPQEGWGKREERIGESGASLQGWLMRVREAEAEAEAEADGCRFRHPWAADGLNVAAPAGVGTVSARMAICFRATCWVESVL
jgi:hypothetical protein